MWVMSHMLCCCFHCLLHTFVHDFSFSTIAKGETCPHSCTNILSPTARHSQPTTQLHRNIHYCGRCLSSVQPFPVGVRPIPQMSCPLLTLPALPVQRLHRIDIDSFLMCRNILELLNLAISLLTSFLSSSRLTSGLRLVLVSICRTSTSRQYSDVPSPLKFPGVLLLLLSLLYRYSDCPDISPNDSHSQLA